MNLSSHILVRMGLDKSQFDAGMRNIKHDLKGLKEVAKFGGAAGIILGVINGFQAIANTGADAVSKLSKAWSDRFRAMGSAISETKEMAAGMFAYLAWAATAVPTMVTRFQGAMLGGANWKDAIQIAWDTGAEERRKRLAPLESELAAQRREASLESMSPEQRLRTLLAELDALIAQRATLKDREAILRKSTEIEKKFQEALAAQNKVKADEATREKDSLRETMELEQKRLATLKQAVESQRQMSAALMDEIGASADLVNAKRDRSALTLEELANARAVNRYTFEEGQRARQAMFFEQRAKYARWMGRTDIENESTNRALALRRGLKALSESERDPMSSLRDTLIKSKEHLRQLLDDEQSGKFSVSIRNTE